MFPTVASSAASSPTPSARAPSAPGLSAASARRSVDRVQPADLPPARTTNAKRSAPSEAMEMRPLSGRSVTGEGAEAPSSAGAPTQSPTSDLVSMRSVLAAPEAAHVREPRTATNAPIQTPRVPVTRQRVTPSSVANAVKAGVTSKEAAGAASFLLAVVTAALTVTGVNESKNAKEILDRLGNPSGHTDEDTGKLIGLYASAAFSAIGSLYAFSRAVSRRTRSMFFGARGAGN